jgi:hypothetical protein
MSQGTYSGSSTYVSLTAAFTTVTFTASAVVEATTGDAVRGGTANAYTLVNDGSIIGIDAGIYLGDGGAITNGSTSGTGALIEGTYGIDIAGASGTVVNFGTIEGAAGAHGAIELQNYSNAGSVTNGSLADTGALIQGYVGIGFQNGLTLTNYGSITGNFAGIDGRTGTIVNGAATDTTALIRGGGIGVDDIAGNSRLTNFATIESGMAAVYHYAVDFGGGTDTIVNGGGGDTVALIEGGGGIRLGTVTSGGVTNYGTILSAADGAISNGTTSHGIGVYLVDGGGVTNEAGGKIEAGGSFGIGVKLAAGGTVTNFGTIEGSEASVMFGSAGDLLIAEAGSDFIGAIEGGGGTLELAGGDGTIAGLGTTATLSVADSATFSGFGSYIIGSAGTWTLTGANTIDGGDTLTVDGVLIDETALHGAGALAIGIGGRLDLAAGGTGETITFLGAAGTLELGSTTGVTAAGFVHGDVIDLTGVSYNSGHMTATYAAGTLGIFDGLTETAEIAATGLAGDSFTLSSDGHTGTDVGIVCFLRGTRILTDRGEIPIEDLDAGTRVVTLSGRGRVLKPIRWIGRRRIDAARHREPGKIYPIRILRDAFGEGMPHRDLLVSPAHALHVEGALVPAAALANGATIFQDRGRQVFEYFHLELDRHDLVLAEGLPSETYLDRGNRRFFDNASGPVDLHGVPDANWCAPRDLRAPGIAAAKRVLASRLEELGYRIGRLAELRLEIGGRRLDPVSVEGNLHRFMPPPGDGEIRLVTAASFPADSADPRILGVSVHAIAVTGSGEDRVLDLTDESRFADGWYRHERDGGRIWRWTDGNARLPVAGPCRIDITLGQPVPRWLAPGAEPAGRAAHG